MGHNGGKRPGAGRPPGRLNNATLDKKRAQEIADQIIRDRIIEKLPEIIDAQIAHAKGVSYMVLRAPDGSFARATDEKQIDAACAIGASAFRIFTQAPNTQAFTALSDRAFDKPVERQEITGKYGGPLVVKWEK